MVDVNSIDGAVLLIMATLGYCIGALLFGLGGLALSFITYGFWRAWGWFYYGFWWDMRYGRFFSRPRDLKEGEYVDIRAYPLRPFGFFEEEDIWVGTRRRATRWYERIIARWVNERGSR